MADPHITARVSAAELQRRELFGRLKEKGMLPRRRSKPSERVHVIQSATGKTFVVLRESKIRYVD
jgi:hypothetical protein